VIPPARNWYIEIWYLELIKYIAITMEFKKIMQLQQIHYQLQIEGTLGLDETNVHLCQQCYLMEGQKKPAEFDRFWKIIQIIDFNVEEYSGQTLYVFSKLAELFFAKGKPHNLSLVAGLRALVSTLEYSKESKVNVTECIFWLDIVFKRLRFFSSSHMD